MDRIRTFLWYETGAEEAARFYTSLFPDSRIEHVTVMPSDSPSGPAGSVRVVDFVLFGRPYTAMTAAGRPEPFGHAVSLAVACRDQAEVDRYWDALLADGGKPEACGWLRDRWGVPWQIVPQAMLDMMKSPDRAAARRATDAMMDMVKLDVAALQRAFDGR